jgi:3'-5' exoribonuclease
MLILGINLHDIGKIKEMKDGDYRKNSFVTHREFGVELLYANRALITEKFDDDFFYRLISIIRGHHDEYEEKAKTVYAYIVHLIDMLDSQVTHILDVVEGEGLKEDSSGDKFVQARDAKWYV